MQDFNSTLILKRNYNCSHKVRYEYMKFGMRTPSIKKSISARTTGRAKRAVKSAINPAYGKKGTGLITNPSKSVKNSVYHKTTKSVWSLFK